MVAVAAGACNGYDGSLLTHYAADGVEHVDERIWGVGVVHYGGHAVGAVYGLETSGHRDEAAHVDEHFLGVEAAEDGGAVDGGEVIGVEAAGEGHLHFVAVEGEQCAVESRLQHAAAEVGVAAQ